MGGLALTSGSLAAVCAIVGIVHAAKPIEALPADFTPMVWLALAIIFILTTMAAITASASRY